AGLTACYMFRAVYLTFEGEFRGTHEQEHHLHESPRVMTVPLLVLAVGAVVSGFVGLPVERLNVIHHFLQPVVYAVAGAPAAEHTATWIFDVILISVAVLLAFAGIGAAFRLYGGTRGLAAE